MNKKMIDAFHATTHPIKAADIGVSDVERLVSVREVIDIVHEYCVLDAEPEDEIEQGYHYAGNGIIKVLKDKYL